MKCLGRAKRTKRQLLLTPNRTICARLHPRITDHLPRKIGD
jgi:hypothetical protein